MSRALSESELTRSLDEPISPEAPYADWPIRPGWPGDGRAGDPAFYRVMLPCCDRPMGIHLGHTWHEAGVLLRMIELASVRRIIEVGVHAGGLAALLIARTIFDPRFEYLGIELDAGLVSLPVKAAIGGRSNIVYGDCFSPTMKIVVSAFIMNAPGRALIYCDDGDKSEEIKHYAPLCRPGDILAMHDFWEPGMSVRDLPEFGPLDRGGRPFPGPEVVPEEIAFLGEAGFNRMEPDVWTPESRIAAFVRIP